MKRLNQMLGEQDLLVQPFLASVKTKGEVSLIFIDNEFVHAVRKKPAQGEFKVQGRSVGWSQRLIFVHSCENAFTHYLVLWL